MNGMSGDFRPRKLMEGKPLPNEADPSRHLEGRKDFTPGPAVGNSKKYAARRAEGSASTVKETPAHPAEETLATADTDTKPEDMTEQTSGKTARPVVPKSSPAKPSPPTSSSRE